MGSGSLNLPLHPGLVTIERAKDFGAPGQAIHVHICGRIKFPDREIRCIGFLFNHVGIAGAAKKAAIARGTVRRMFHIPQMHKWGHRRVLFLLHTEHGAHARWLEVFVQRATAHDVDIALAMFRGVRVHRANQ